MSITEFLLATIAEDEAVARNAAMRIDDDRRAAPDMRDLASVYADHAEYRDEWQA